MLYWIPYAFVRITVFFIAGILAAIFFPSAFSSVVLASAAATLTVVFFVIWFLNRSRRRTLVNPGIIGLTTIFCLGYLNVLFEDDSNRETFFRRNPPFSFYVAHVAGELHEKEKSWQQVVEIQRTRDESGWHDASGHIFLSYSKDAYAQPFQYGDVLLIKGQPNEVQGAMNPGEFDYK